MTWLFFYNDDAPKYDYDNLAIAFLNPRSALEMK